MNLELAQRHALVEQPVLVDLAVGSNSRCQSAALIGGIAPVTGRQSVIDRPEPVSRVSPPTAIIATTSANSTISQTADRAARAGRRRSMRARAGGAGCAPSATSSKDRALGHLLLPLPAAS
jgi:hypothetical protein